MIIIFSIENDFSTAAVARWLDHYGQEVVVINSNDHYNKLVRINAGGIYFKNTFTNKEYNLLEAKSCWWRRSGISLKNFLHTEQKKEFFLEGVDVSDIIKGPKSIINSEVNDLRDYIFEKIYNNCAVNIGHPKLYSLNKLITIDLARKHGFKVPEYEVITNLGQISDAHTINDAFVTKSIAEGIYHMVDKQMYYTFTELHHKASYAREASDIFPSLIMNLVNKKLEIRTFYLAGHFYSMAIFSQANEQTKVDFRKYSSTKPNKMEPYKLPDIIEMRLKDIFESLGLNCGSVDLILDTDGEFVFLEINPVGQYGMTSEPGNYNLDKIIAKYLIDGKVS